MRVLLRHYLEQGLSKTGIACTLGVSRRTVYHWIDTGQLDREMDGGPATYGPRPAMSVDGGHAFLQGDVDNLHGCVLLQPVNIEFHANARGFDTAERRHGM